MGNKQKAKGTRFENKVMEELREHFIVEHMQRTSPGSASDIDIHISGKEKIRVQCKKRAEGFKSLYKWIEDNDMLVVGADHKPSLLIVRLSDFRTVAWDLWDKG